MKEARAEVGEAIREVKQIINDTRGAEIEANTEIETDLTISEEGVEEDPNE